MMIYELTMIFSKAELPLLELKLENSLPVVDKFVVVESCQTFAGNTKEKIFDEEKYKDPKIEYHYIWNQEFFKAENQIKDSVQRAFKVQEKQREFPNRIYDFKNYDKVFVSDLDEITHKDSLKFLSESNHTFIAQFLSIYTYYINGFLGKNCWHASYMTRGDYIKKYGINQLRYKAAQLRGYDYIPVPKNLNVNGAHLCWLGGADAIKYKINNFSARRYDRLEITETLEDKIKRLKDPLGYEKDITLIPLDNTFPLGIEKLMEFYHEPNN